MKLFLGKKVGVSKEEFTNLAAILPEVYAENKDNF